MLKISRGFTLIEMMIGVALLAILISLAVPNFSMWIKNLGIRTAAESITSGLTLARTEALKKNTTMRFQLTTSVDGDCALYVGDEAPNWAWVVSRSDAVGKCDAVPDGASSDEEEEGGEAKDETGIVQTYDGTLSGGNNLRVAAGQNLFTFNGLGRLTSAPANILVTDAEGEEGCASKSGKARCLRIEVTTGGIRMCDPALPHTDTQACS
jgi:type IV fimbrial biogenesis protein FimT